MEKGAWIRPSTQFAIALVAFAFGVAAANLVHVSLVVSVMLLFFAGVFFFFICHLERVKRVERSGLRGFVRFFVFLVLSFSLGTLRLVLAHPVPDGHALIGWHGRDVELAGRVARVSSDGYRTRIIVEAREPGRGRAWATVRDASVRVG